MCNSPAFLTGRGSHCQLINNAAIYKHSVLCFAGLLVLFKSRCSWSAALHRSLNVWAALFWLHAAIWVWKEMLPESHSSAAQLLTSHDEFVVARLFICFSALRVALHLMRLACDDEAEHSTAMAQQSEEQTEQILQEKVQQLLQAANMGAYIDFTSFGSNDCLLVYPTQWRMEIEVLKRSQITVSASPEGPGEEADLPKARTGCLPMLICESCCTVNIKIFKAVLSLLS